MAKKIFLQAHRRKQLYLVPNAGHNDLITIGGRALTPVLQKFAPELASDIAG